MLNHDRRTELLAEQLGKTILFRGLPLDLRMRIAALGKVRTFSGKEVIFHEGDPGLLMFVLLSGSVSVERIGPDGVRRVLAQRRAGEHVGELALLDDSPRSAAVVTLENTQTFTLRRDDLRRLLKAEPDIALQVILSLATRLRETEERAESLTAKSLTKRLASALAARAALVGPNLNSLSDRELGAQVGAARESVSRAMKTLKAKNLAERLGRHILVHDAEGLREFAERGQE